MSIKKGNCVVNEISVTKEMECSCPLKLNSFHVKKCMFCFINM